MSSIGFDIHGVIDRKPDLFKVIIDELRGAGYSIHILTGQEGILASEALKKWGISYDYLFSILDWCYELGIPIREDEKGKWVDDDIWKTAKGKYAERVGLNVHFDNDIEYAEGFPKGCYFILIDDDKEIHQEMWRVHGILKGIVV